MKGILVLRILHILFNSESVSTGRSGHLTQATVYSPKMMINKATGEAKINS